MIILRKTILGLLMALLFTVFYSCGDKDVWSEHAGFYVINKATMGDSVYTDCGAFSMMFTFDTEDEILNDFYGDVKYPSAFMQQATDDAWGVIDGQIVIKIYTTSPGTTYRVEPDIKKLSKNKYRWTLTCFKYNGEANTNQQIGGTEVIEVTRMKNF